MNNCEKVKKVAALLTEQNSVVSEIYGLQKNMHGSVMNRDWSGTEQGFAAIGTLTSKFSALDKKLFDELGEDGAENFFSFTQTLPEEDKNLLDRLYKALKQKVSVSKYENEAFSAYVNHAKSLTQGMVDIIAESRSGSAYNFAGKKTSADISSLVLNRVF